MHPYPNFTTIMQFKLIALLTLVVAFVNGAAIHKRFSGVYTPSTSSFGSNTRFSGTCDCGGTQYDNEAITDAFDQSKKGSFGLYAAYLSVIIRFLTPSLPASANTLMGSTTVKNSRFRGARRGPCKSSLSSNQAFLTATSSSLVLTASYSSV